MAQENLNKEVVKGTPRVTNCTLVQTEKAPTLVAFANAIIEGKVFMSSVAVRLNKEGEAYLTFPARKRTKNGQDVLDEKTGKPIYDDFYGPADKETRNHVNEIVFQAVQDAMDGKEPEKKEKGEEKVSVNLISDVDGLVAYAHVVTTGKFFITGISVHQPQNGDAFLSLPSRKRTKNGEAVLDEKGKVIYDTYFGPADSNTRNVLNEMVMTAVQEEYEK